MRRKIEWDCRTSDLTMPITTVKRAWKNLLTDAGIENFTWHDQRHDFASQHVMSGTDVYTVMELLGHSDPKMTKRYAHLATEHKVAAAKQLAKRRGDMMNRCDGEENVE
ncbi:MAG: tyrosine-type recombinase/integrase [Gammaproteobacteria bacterium]|nr:tyrosine-type recombinase/integrase [Gammaproteobacteria bacterium]